MLGDLVIREPAEPRQHKDIAERLWQGQDYLFREGNLGLGAILCRPAQKSDLRFDNTSSSLLSLLVDCKVGDDSEEKRAKVAHWNRRIAIQQADPCFLNEIIGLKSRETSTRN